MPTWSNIKLATKLFFHNHPIIAYGFSFGSIFAASYLCIGNYLHERKAEQIADNVSRLEKMVEAHDFNGARPLAQSLYDDMNQEQDARLKQLYDDFVFPCYKRLNDSGQ